MSDVWGNSIKVSIFGESHGNAIGITLDELPAGYQIDMDKIEKEMKRRAPGRSAISTPRKESDIPEIVSGIFNGKTTGNTLCGIIRNTDTRSKDYSQLKDLMRPGHSDYTGSIRYKGFNDYRGGGHFSGRLTAPLVFAGAVCKQILDKKGVYIGAHIKSIKDVSDDSFDYVNITKEQLLSFSEQEIPLIDTSKEELIRNTIIQAKKNEDSVGGVIECAVIGLNPGLGSPFFDSVESVLSHILFSVPAIKGVEFGLGFDITKLYGSESNDAFYYDGDNVKTKTNNNGGILGGITSGMPLVFKTAVKPTASIGIEQDTVNISTKKNDKLVIQGRHDPCIAQRAVPVIEAVTAIAILGLMKERYGCNL